MKTLVKLGMVVVLLSVGGAAAYNPITRYIKERNRPHWRTAPAERGRLVYVVNSTGTVEPVLSVSVGSFVSGPITELHVDFNDVVQEDEVLAEIDPRLFAANVDRDRAILATREAEVERAEAQLQQALNSENRGLRLREENPDFLSDAEMDALIFETRSLRAQLKLAEASVSQSRASLANSEANLDYTQIKSPVSGVVIDRKIDPGQTLAAQFQTPELFVVAPDLRQKVHVFASVDESEIGLIQRAQAEGRRAKFTVDAHPDELFEGEIEQIRLSATTNQNVVTYPVVVAASNPDLRLLPGMTANISFEADARDDVLKVPTAAIRFYPSDEKHVREEDRDVLDGSRLGEEGRSSSDVVLSASQLAEARRRRNQRHVWAEDGFFLRAVQVTTGISDGKYTEILAGDLSAGDELVIGIKPKKK